jgi:hypothetical protein
MHKVIQTYLSDFIDEFSISQSRSKGEQFERFVNYYILYDKYQESFDIEDVTSDSVECGIDGLCYLIGNQLISTIDDAKAIFERGGRNLEASVFFIQSKSSEKFIRKEITNFKDAIEDFLAESQNLPMGEFLTSRREIWECILGNVGKIRNGRPNCYVFYVTTGEFLSQEAISGSFSNIERSLTKTGNFHNVKVNPLGREEIINLCNKSRLSVEAKFKVTGFLPYPSEISGIDQAYLTITSAKNFVQNVLSDEDGNLRKFIFEENVRSFLGLGKDNSVNQGMLETLEDLESKKRFGILNNGITIIANTVVPQNNFIYISDFQIINGCQTSNVLYQKRELLDSDDVVLNVKVVSVSDPDVVSALVKATNRQTQIDDTQFLSLQPIARRVERYFNVTSSNQQDITLYFERREKQFASENVPKNRIFNFKDLCRGVISMFYDRPDLVKRYTNDFFSKSGMEEKIFSLDNKEIAFYTAALSLYRLSLLLRRDKLPYNYYKYKWHMLMALKYAILGKGKGSVDITKPSSLEVCQTIINVCSKSDETTVSYFLKAKGYIEETGEYGVERIRLTEYTNSLKRNIFSK